MIRGRYRLVQLIASGGLGHVYYGWDEQLERVVAIKRLKKDAADLGQNLESALKEAKTLAALQHPNVVTLFDYGVDEDGAFYVLEYIEGETLDHRIETYGALNEETFLDIARQALEGVNAAHKCGIIHRDLKPSNLMLKNSLSGGLHVKVLDFGLAKFQQTPSPQTMDESNSIMGSIYYASPEQFQGLPLDERSDLYSLGHLFYTSLVGSPAFNGATIYETIMLHLQTEPQPLAQLRPDLDPYVCEWIHSLIARDPDQRPVSSAQALHALINWQRMMTQPLKVTSPAQEIPVLEEETKTKSKAGLWIALGAAAVLALAGGGFWMMQSGGKGEVAAAGAPAPVVAPPPGPSPVPEAPAPASSVPATAEPAPAAENPAPAVAEADAGGIVDPANLALFQQNLGKVITVRGKIVDFGENKKGTIYYLNFARNYKDALALIFFIGDHPEDFTKENLSKFLDKDVEAKGKIQEHMGAYQMKIESLADLKESGN